MKWIKIKSLNDLPQGLVEIFFIRYDGGTQKESGTVIHLRDLYENGWEDIEYLDESSPSDNTQSIDKELAGKIWDAACKFNHEEFMYLERGIHIQAPDKETFINSLNLDNTQIRDGGYRREDMEKEYKRGFDDGVKYRDGQHKAYFTIES